jgi:hypothetical protein
MGERTPMATMTMIDGEGGDTNDSGEGDADDGGDNDGIYTIVVNTVAIIALTTIIPAVAMMVDSSHVVTTVVTTMVYVYIYLYLMSLFEDGQFRVGFHVLLPLCKPGRRNVGRGRKRKHQKGRKGREEGNARRKEGRRRKDGRRRKEGRKTKEGIRNYGRKTKDGITEGRKERNTERKKEGTEEGK